MLQRVHRTMGLSQRLVQRSDTVMLVRAIHLTRRTHCARFDDLKRVSLAMNEYASTIIADLY